MKIAASFLTSIYDRVKTLELLDESKADYIHVDLCDGNFVEAKNFTKEEIVALLENLKKPLDVHLMAINPLEYVEIFAPLNPKHITIHVELDNVSELIEKIRLQNIKVGLAINPETPVEKLIPYLNIIDLVIVMSVPTGKGGCPFMKEMLAKVEFLNKYRQDNNLDYKITIDGGINDETIQLCKGKGIDIYVVGSYICKSTNYDEKIDKLLQ